MSPYNFIAAATGIEMDPSTIGQHTFDIGSEGVAHIGMLPDLIVELKPWAWAIILIHCSRPRISMSGYGMALGRQPVRARSYSSCHSVSVYMTPPSLASPRYYDELDFAKDHSPAGASGGVSQGVGKVSIGWPKLVLKEAQR